MNVLIALLLLLIDLRQNEIMQTLHLMFDIFLFCRFGCYCSKAKAVRNKYIDELRKQTHEQSPA